MALHVSVPQPHLQKSQLVKETTITLIIVHQVNQSFIKNLVKNKM
jgi:hypothetical protein